MRTIAKNNCINFILIFGLISAWLSPACSFISSHSNLIEVCTVYGLEKVFVPQKNETPDNKPNSSSEDCLFCLYSYADKIAFSNIKGPFQRKSNVYSLTVNYTSKNSTHASLYDATGPPYFS
jgi:hypothetical protein